MRSNSSKSRLCNGLFSALLALTFPLLAGCLESDVTRHMKYNAEDDSFEILSVFSHIQAQTAADLDHAGDLYKVRSNLIHPIAPIAIFTQPAWIRKSASEYVETNLGAGTDGAPEMKKTKIDLDSITVKPGKFFVNKNGMPAYYHRIVVPGKAFDGLLAEFDKFIKELTADSVKGERKRRAEGHPILTRAQVLAVFTRESREKIDRKNIGTFPFNACSEESLALLAERAAEGKLHVIRDQARFSIALPLTPADAKEIAEMLKLGKRKILESAEKEDVAPHFVAIVESFRTEVADSGSVTLSIDLGKLLSDGADEPESSKRDGNHLDNTTVVAGLKERGIPFDEKLTHETVVKEFVE